MTEEIQTKDRQKNTIATIGMVFSIVGLILLISIFGAWIWLFLLIIWFILWIIWLFYKPKKRARIAVCIPLIVFIILTCVFCYVWSSIKTPAKEFIDWTQSRLENINEWSFDNTKFENLLESELNDIVNNKSKDEWKSIYETSTGSNNIEKWSYLFFSILKQWFENALEKYNEDISDTEDETNNLLNENVDDETLDNEKETIEKSQENSTGDTTIEESEQNDIEEILNILE